MSLSTIELPVSEPASSPERGRFAFGRNWTSFLRVLNEHRIAAAERSLQAMLGRDDLVGQSFLDIGSGSGLFSLAARRLGARVHSCDLDPDAVACTQELRRRYYPGDPSWGVTRTSVLDAPALAALGRFDVVYSWGVLHHTGDLWRALELAAERVAPGGRLFVAIYNDAGRATRRWASIKRLYGRVPAPLRAAYTLLVGAPGLLRRLAAETMAGRGRAHLARLAGRTPRERGMNTWHDLVDWVGGYPYQAARADEVFSALHARGFCLERLKADRGLGCNEFVFARTRAGR